MPDSPNLSSKLADLVKEKAKDVSFPERGTDYFARFAQLDKYLNENVHPHVNQGPTAREPIWLTDHGPEHISTVIHRASDLVFPNTCVLSPYEAYLLLVAAHFHDVGNVFGRKEHERRCREVMFATENAYVGSDSSEKRMICDIATAHGGFADAEEHDKDTIAKLKYDRPPQGDAKTPRVKMLAAVLRFADELADDHTRTNRFIMNASKQLCPGSEIYHLYADRLKLICINASEHIIDLRFELNLSAISRKYQRHDKSRYLIDEIMDRTLKMHREHIYCTRFMLPYVLIDRINVSIDVCTNDYSFELGKIAYVMMQHGYPDIPTKLIDICPELSGLSGYKLKKRIMRLKQGMNPTSSPYEEQQNLLEG